MKREKEGEGRGGEGKDRRGEEGKEGKGSRREENSSFGFGSF